jgi:hypothetical protein
MGRGAFRFGEARNGLAGQGFLTLNWRIIMAELIEKGSEYPLWSLAVSNVLDRFESDEYDSMFTHDEMKGWMGIRKALIVDDVQKEQLDYLTGIEKVKSNLLDNYNICLFRVTGYGFKILHPTEQIRQGADNYVKKSQKALTRFVRVLVNVDIEKLDIESRDLQLNKLNRAAFIKAAFRKRKLPVLVNQKVVE